MNGPLRLPPGYDLVALEQIGSTNDEARRLALAGAEDGTLVWAREQVTGRGRRGRNWTSPPGNLYTSLILRPDCTPGEAVQLGMVAAVAIGDALGTLLPPMSEVRFKWPNDILVHDRKIAGILLESSAMASGKLEWLVLGIGVNIENFPADTTFPATCLKEWLGEDDGPISVEGTLEAVCRSFLLWINIWQDEGFPPVRAAWLGRAWRMGEEIEVRLEDGILRGTFCDIDEAGALLLELPGGEKRRITAADVFAAPAAE